MNYTNREVVRRLKQYDMFLNSLSLITDEVQRERICDQLDKIEKQILLETNTEYEEQYMILFGEESKFFAEEKNRLRKLISLVNERKKYLEDRKNKHREVTGSLVELTTFLGEDKLSVFKRRLEIIEKYEENKSRQENIIREMKKLDVKLSEASRIVKANTRLNDILENKMKDVINKALDKFKLYSLTSKRNEIQRNYDNFEYVLDIAKDNLNTATSLGDSDAILECNELLAEVSSEFSKYSEQVNIIKLIDIYDKKVNGYDELLEKREDMNEILKNISDSELYKQISDELNKEYNTIKLEKQDIENYETLKQEREKRNKLLYEIDEENNSKEFKSVIEEIVKNENRLVEEKIRKAKQEEYKERQKKLLEEQKIEASRVRRQKLIEEARLKEQQERLAKVKALQEKTVINPKKEGKVNISKESKTINVIKEEPINNPLKNKTFEEMMSFSNDFDTDELFENTKIVPNKKINEEKSLFDTIESRSNEVKIEEPILPTWTTPIEETPVIEEPVIPKEETVIPVWEEPVGEKTQDLFKDESKVEELVIKEEPVQKVESKEPSIYDILENNKNIIWKTTDTDINKSTIPVIGNNNLKPEILDNRKVDNITFPKIDNSKEGEILWKETL